MHGNSLALFKRFGLPYFRDGMDVLEIGPDPQWLCKAVVDAKRVRYRHADAANGALSDPGCIRMPEEYRLDCPDETFDVVFSANVVEHVRKPWKWLAELSRVTKLGGHIVCVNPVSWPYHEAPRDCWRLLPEAYKALFEDVGLEHAFSWHGNLAPIDPHWLVEHGPQLVTDTIAIARKPAARAEGDA
jgi:SAM-dependent methyltransferase